MADGARPDLKVLAFDVFGTVVDWRSGVMAEVAAIAVEHFVTIDGAEHHVPIDAAAFPTSRSASSPRTSSIWRLNSVPDNPAKPGLGYGNHLNQVQGRVLPRHSGGRLLVSQRSTAGITCWGQCYGRASGGLLHAKPRAALPTLAVDRVVVTRRLIGKVMTGGAQPIGGRMVQRGVGGGGLSVDHFANCKAGSAGAIAYGQHPFVCRLAWHARVDWTS